MSVICQTFRNVAPDYGPIKAASFSGSRPLFLPVDASLRLRPQSCTQKLSRIMETGEAVFRPPLIQHSLLEIKYFRNARHSIGCRVPAGIAYTSFCPSGRSAKRIICHAPLFCALHSQSAFHKWRGGCATLTPPIMKTLTNSLSPVGGL